MLFLSVSARKPPRARAGPTVPLAIGLVFEGLEKLFLLQTAGDNKIGTYKRTGKPSRLFVFDDTFDRETTQQR